ncbi:MAG: phenylacetate--CoA ligase family protein, partial [Dehalococcoidales bacterium]|nr:phenylacetate--CoA ligase family protein [Dehalococcoidales bacterium]
MAVEQGKYFDDREIMPQETRLKLQEESLYQTVGYFYRNSPFVKRILDKAGVRPFQIRTVKDLELLPVTRKNDLIEAQAANNPPKGGLA